MLLGIYNYTVLLTYFSMLVSFTGIILALQGQVSPAVICLMVSGVCDMLDGKIAATKLRTHQEKRFGIHIDSLSDLICFGVFPAVLVYILLGQHPVIFLAGGFYLLCALIRLAWFNVDEEARQDREDGSRTVYLGLPVTTAALIFPLLFGLGRLWNWPFFLYPLVLVALGIAFLTPFPLKKPAFPGKLGAIWGGAGLLLLLVGVRL